MGAAGWTLLVGGGILFILGHFGTLRWMYEESMLLTFLGFFFPAVTLIYAFLHREEHAGEFWFEAIGLTAATAGFLIHRGIA